MESFEKDMKRLWVVHEEREKRVLEKELDTLRDDTGKWPCIERQLVPKMKESRQLCKRAYLAYDTLYIEGSPVRA
ncbi:hypothetical protein DPMN_154496 [Dreissena polymorpha]|uniref:Uncharacterized protein n=1 Tax=Dreissena polymorpha TaxID=45954 RepID=A0A9D4J9Z0_DREPO|nr:hypothetical protein DPMN_154496 [Dreissena polymorpha]